MAPVIHQLSQTIPPDSTSSALTPGSSGPRATKVLIREPSVSKTGRSFTFTPPSSYAFTDDPESNSSNTITVSGDDSSSSRSNDNSGGGLSGPIKGAIIGSILGTVFLLLLLYCCYRRSPRAIVEHRRKHRRNSKTLRDSPEPAPPEPAPAEPKPEEPAEPAPTLKKKKTVRIAPGSTPPPHFVLYPQVRTPAKVKVKLYPNSEEAKGAFSPIERYTMDVGAGAHVRIKKGRSGPTAFVSRPRDGTEGAG
ncbi:uncharacterized protein N7511_002938 [Penicillium nucicola]|uniref:uncharacterized protein n=1 Tax=Penicillium nucicola TaxID=1850975 RepID=UPI002544E8C3|nr:uncharacterized protein N7511_002938 [Penicillium nucicola]KAJ5770887.1 hypothetical protein N7511_002938 [Penicillium nucicola]